MNIPSLRFPEFSGEWEMKKLGEVAEKVNSGKTPLGGEDVYVDDGVLFIRSQNVFDNTLSYENSTFITEEVNSTMKNSVVKPKDILLNITGASLGRSCVVPEEFDTGNVNQHVCIIRLDKNNEPYFFQPIFASEKGQNIFISLQTGSGREGLNFQSIKSITLPVPSLPEQQKIATFLTAVDEKLAQLKKKKTLLEQYKKGVMQKIFSQNIRFKDNDGKDFPEWEEKSLGEICDIFGGGTPDTSIEEYWNGSIQWFTPTEIKNDFVSTSIRTITDLGLKKSSAKLLPKGTILLTTRATIGEVSIALEECTTNQGFQSLVANKNVNNVYIFNWLKENKHELVKRANGSTFPEISKSEIELIEIPTPCLSEQTKIANFLSAIDDKINHTTAQIEKTQQWKKGLLQQMFV